MNDVRDAIDRVGAPFDPREAGFDDLTRRQTRARTRRRILAGALALAVMGGGSLLLVRAFPSPSSPPRPELRVIASWAAGTVAQPTAGSARVKCPTPSGDSPPPVVLSSTSGAAGSSIEVTGTFWDAGLWMQLWWNAGEIGDKIPMPPWPPTGPDLQLDPAGPGPVLKLAAIGSASVTGECSFKTRFSVPDVQPGIYQVQWLFGGAGGPRSPRPASAYIISPSDHEATFAVVWSSVLSFRVTG
jgi:hypothetical protein